MGQPRGIAHRAGRIRQLPDPQSRSEPGDDRQRFEHLFDTGLASLRMLSHQPGHTATTITTATRRSSINPRCPQSFPALCGVVVGSLVATGSFACAWVGAGLGPSLAGHRSCRKSLSSRVPCCCRDAVDAMISNMTESDPKRHDRRAGAGRDRPRSVVASGPERGHPAPNPRTHDHGDPRRPRRHRPGTHRRGRWAARRQRQMPPGGQGWWESYRSRLESVAWKCASA
jgi:hypothetical protein